MIHAKKLISEVIYEYQLENLSRHSRLVTVHQEYPARQYRYQQLRTDTTSHFQASDTEVYRSYPLKF
ncbi:hypothetical protein RRG08_007874 [Elysia crispata]|uniref:Uncharacterized protein n=1 Tax=Elysia crispata TaxID=231223 RepID=A0AAE1CN59_9GAST|nr:hypothetical protein RRG08_007874 [Elysia crispata]